MTLREESIIEGNSTQQHVAEIAEKFMAVWKNLHNKYLLKCLVEKILEHLSEDEIVHREVLTYLEAEKGVDVEKDESISISESELCKINNIDAKRDLGIALKAVLGLIDKDNRHVKDNITLYHLSTHLENLFDNLKQYVTPKITWDIQEFLLVMKICHFYGLLGQSLVQGSNRSKFNLREALKVLKKAVQKIWLVCDAGNSESSLLCCQAAERPDADAMEYKPSNDPITTAEHITHWCVKASERIDLQVIDEYVKGTVKINRSNYQDFLSRCNGSGMRRDEAKDKLRPVETCVDQGGRITDELLEILRGTNNMLSAEDYRKVCLAEQIVSNLHIFARAVLYWREIMTEAEQTECEYYGKLAHYICVKIKEKTQGVALLHEYITKANFMVPRKLHDPNHSESHENRLARLKEAREDAYNLFNDPGVMFECGKFKQVEGTPYTLMNAQKYIVKANSKIVRYLSEAEKQDALTECNKLYDLAKAHTNIAMSYNCCIQAMKGFAELCEFEKAFEAFETGFHANGIATLYESNTGTYVWALFNYALCVVTYLQFFPDDLLKLESGIKRCTMALKCCKVDGETRSGLKDLEERLENIQKKLCDMSQ